LSSDLPFIADRSSRNEKARGLFADLKALILYVKFVGLRINVRLRGFSMFDRVLHAYYFKSQILSVEIACLLYLSFVETVGIEELVDQVYILD